MCPYPPAVQSSALDVPPVGTLSMFQTDTSSYPGNLLLLPYSLFSQRPSPPPQSLASTSISMFTMFPSSLFLFSFNVLNVPDLGYLKSLLNFLPSSSLCTSIIGTMAWLIFPRHCFVMPHSCSRISGGFPSFPESKAHVP